MNEIKSIYRDNLPQLEKKAFITDGGLETVFVFQKMINLPMFAAFNLLNSDDGIAALKEYYLPYVGLALRHRTGLILDTATWRASTGWGRQLGYSAADIRRFNQLSVKLLTEIRARYTAIGCPMVVNGVIGPQSDGYNPRELLDISSAESYHAHQVEAFADSAADLITAVTMTYAEEAIGITRAAQKVGLPVAISLTVETDGCLPDGSSLQEAIRAVDEATDAAPAYFMINCAHPSHFLHLFEDDPSWSDRIYGVRANASCKSHAELDEAVELDDGSPEEFGKLYVELKNKLRNLSIVGGCCGTDDRHIGEVCRSFLHAES